MAFGGQVDYFDLANNLPAPVPEFTLLESSKTPVSESRADATDENGDIAAATWFGNDAADLFDISCTYVIAGQTTGTGDTVNLNELTLGEIDSTDGIIISGIEVVTSQGDWPKVTITGKLGADAVVAPTGLKNIYTLPSATITAIKAAQPIGFTVSDGKLTSCSFSATCDIAQQDDGSGEPLAHGVSGAVGTVSAEFVNVSAQPAWTLTLAGLTQTQAPTTDDPQAAYGTSSASAEVIIARDTTP